jgi:hypothetical protein
MRRSSGLYTPHARANLRAHVAVVGLSQADVHEAIELAREWATRIAGSGSALWPISGSN